MPAIYAAADVLMLPSDARETWGLVCNEALASGRPILVSDGAGCSMDLSSDGQVGAVFATGDMAAASRALSGILRAPPSLQAIARRSEAYSLGAAADGVMAAIERSRTGRLRQVGARKS